MKEVVVLFCYLIQLKFLSEHLSIIEQLVPLTIEVLLISF